MVCAATVNDSSRSGGNLEIHATCIELRSGADAAGVLLTGTSGCGKSTLALRLADQPGFGIAGNDMITTRIVADDRVCVSRQHDQILAAPLTAGEGLCEVRGLGIVKSGTAVSLAPVSVCIEHAESAAIERMPEPMHREFLGIDLPVYRLDFRAPCTPSCLRTIVLVIWGRVNLLND
jgi:serine kinase of HPr protein (carbohydrate metabolism regulator)